MKKSKLIADFHAKMEKGETVNVIEALAVIERLEDIIGSILVQMKEAMKGVALVSEIVREGMGIDHE